MRHQIYNTAAALLSAVAVLSLFSCEKEIKYIGQYDGEKLIVNCCANTAVDSLIAYFSISHFFLDQSTDKPHGALSGVKATIEASGNTYSFKEDKYEKGKYICHYQVKEGEKVTLKARYDCLKSIESTITIPTAPKIQVKSWSEKENQSYWGSKEVTVKATIFDDQNANNYYRLLALSNDSGYFHTMYAYSTDIMFMSLNTGIFDIFDNYFDDEQRKYYFGGLFDDSKIDSPSKDFEFNMTMYIPNYLLPPLYGTEDFDYENFSTKDLKWEIPEGSMAVQLESLSEDLYKYQISLDMEMDTDDFFSEPVPIHNNIKGGIGIFGAITPYIAMIN